MLANERLRLARTSLDQPLIKMLAFRAFQRCKSKNCSSEYNPSRAKIQVALHMLGVTLQAGFTEDPTGVLSIPRMSAVLLSALHLNPFCQN